MTLKKNIGIITQARMTSSRLPGKVLKNINNNPLLYYHLNRLKHVGCEYSVATTVNKTDDLICEYCDQKNIKYHRGSESNVLSRYFETAAKFQYDYIVRVTSDCPLIDPGLIRQGIDQYVEFDNPDLYLSNTIERTFARGFDFEIFSFDSLRDAFNDAKEESDLEHVTPYIWKNKSGKIDLYYVKQDVDNSRLRITVDVAEDFELVEKLIVDYKADKLPYGEIENILINHPELTEINIHVDQKRV